MINKTNNKTLGVMQPYIFPYIGYFCHIHASDNFIIYDDVGFIKQGWINRNRILLHGKIHNFVIPLSQSTSNRLINEIKIHNFSQFKKKFINTIYHGYKSTKYFDQGMEYLDMVTNGPADKISDLATSSITHAIKILKIKTNIKLSSTISPKNNDLDRSDRLIYLTKLSGCSTYLNTMGGKDLYDPSYFEQNGIELKFIIPKIVSYKPCRLCIRNKQLINH